MHPEKFHEIVGLRVSCQILRIGGARGIRQLVVEPTQLKHSQKNWNLPQIGMNIKIFETTTQYFLDLIPPKKQQRNQGLFGHCSSVFFLPFFGFAKIPRHFLANSAVAFSEGPTRSRTLCSTMDWTSIPWTGPGFMGSRWYC